MKRFPFFVCLAFLLLLVQTGITSAAIQTTTNATTVTTTSTTIAADNTTAAATATPELTGGSIYFETDPSGATIWLDNVNIGTSPFTYYSRKTGTMDVRIWKKGYEEHTDTVTASEGKRVVFSALLTRVSYEIMSETLPITPVRTTMTIRKSTITVPTPWPTSAASAPVDPVVGVGAAAIAVGFLANRRR
jgi:hypothetical protein